MCVHSRSLARSAAHPQLRVLRGLKHGTGNGVIPCQNVDTVRWVVDCSTTMPLEDFKQQNFVADLILFTRNFCEKRQIWIPDWTPFWEVRGDARPCWKANCRLSVRSNWTFFAIYYGSGAMRRNVYSSAVFTGVDLFALKFYLDSSHQPFLA